MSPALNRWSCGRHGFPEVRGSDYGIATPISPRKRLGIVVTEQQLSSQFRIADLDALQDAFLVSMLLEGGSGVHACDEAAKRALI